MSSLLVDPLDGTKEFIAGSSEYTVNLALVRDRVPVAGIMAVPACGLIYRGVVGRGAERLAMAADGTIAADAPAPITNPLAAPSDDLSPRSAARTSIPRRSRCSIGSASHGASAAARR